MKKILFLIIIVYGSCNSCFSQTWQYYDSLQAIYLQKQSYDTALVYAEKSLQAVKEKTGENDTLYANMLRAIMDINYYMGKYAIAIEYCKKEKEIRKTIQGEKHPDYATTLNCLASLYDVSGNYPAAEPLYLDAKSILKEVLGEKNPYYASCLNDLAQLYWEMGNFSAAEPLYIESKNIRKEILGEKHPDYAISLNNLAVLYQEMGNYPASEALLLEAKNIYKEVLGEKHPDYALPLSNLAVLYWSMGNYSAAEPLLQEAKKLVKETLGEKHPEYAFYLNNLGKLYLAMGNYPAAEALLLEAKNVRKVTLGEKHPDYATSLNNLAGLYDAAGNFQAAEPLYLEAKNIRKEVLGEKHLDFATSLNNLAVLYEAMGNSASSEKDKKDKYTAAEPLYLQCLEIINSNIAQNFAFLSEKEKEMFFKTQASDFENFYSFSLKRKKEDQGITKIVFNNVVKNKGLLLKSSTAMRMTILNSNDTALILQYENWIALKKEISNLYSTEIAERNKNSEELEQQANAIEKELVKGSQVFSDFEKLQSMTWESVKKSLKPGEAAIEFIRFTEGKKSDTITYCALIITPESQQPEMIRLFEEKEIKAILGISGDNNNSYVNTVYGTNKNIKEDLYKLIWQPIEPYLKDVKTVYYSPDGILHKVSFSALGMGKSIFLCDNYNLQQVGSTGKVASDSYRKPENTLWESTLTAGVYGGIEYSTDSTTKKIWNYLPGTKTETDNITKLFNKNRIRTSYFSGISATEDTLKSIAANCNILHVSTHGFFFPDPEQTQKEQEAKTEKSNELIFRGGTTGFGLWQFVKNKNPLMRSGLVMAGANKVWSEPFAGTDNEGVLTAQEVTQLDMSKTHLVVLSACETGLGDIKGSEGVYGLQRAFKMAGVNYIIMSLWQVPDKETVEFMETFYKNFLKLKDVRKAFNETQKAMRKKYDPYFWAAFVLIE